MSVAGHSGVATAGAAISALSVAAAFWLLASTDVGRGVAITAALIGIGFSMLLVWYNTQCVARLIAGATYEVPASRPDYALFEPTEIVRDTEYATMIAEVVAVAAKQVKEVSMPIHILLNTAFGQLDENQEELLGAAEVALEELSNQLNHLREIADADRGALKLQPEPVRLGDVLRGLEPLLRSLASTVGVLLEFNVAPALPRALGNTSRLRDALRLALSDAIRYAVPGTTVRLAVWPEGEKIVVSVDHGSPHAYSASLILADRLLAAQGGSVTVEDGRTTASIRRFGSEATALATPRPL